MAFRIPVLRLRRAPAVAALPGQRRSNSSAARAAIGLSATAALGLALPALPGGTAAAQERPAGTRPGQAAVAGRPTLLAQADRAEETVIVTEAEGGRQLTLRRGEQVRVVLGDNAGTGYSWEIERVDLQLLRPEGQRTWQDPGPPRPDRGQGSAGLVGGPLQVSFLFRAIASGQGELVLRHWRPWEGPGSVDRRLQLRLHVVP